MDVECDIEFIELEGEYDLVPSVMATCTLCQHTTESFGESESSITRCLALMREECPNGEYNFYVEK